MSKASTNRDLYLAIAALTAREKESPRSLEEYLRALGSLADERRGQVSLTLAEFLGLLAGAFTAKAPPFDASWRDHPDSGRASGGYRGWEATLRRQVVDLREMEEQGVLADEQRYFGVNSPRGGRWYNFDPCTFLECGTQGHFGGWAPGDDTGRDYVSGPVLVLEEDGRLAERAPQDVPNPIFPLPAIDWDDFRRFLEQGQSYE